MSNMMLAAAAVLSLGVGSILAASPSYAGNAGTNQGAAAVASVTAAPGAQQGSPLYIGPVPNPWDGSESWKQWNADHPLVGGDGG